MAVLLCLVFTTFFQAGCDSSAGTIREIRTNLDVFKTTPNMSTLEALDKSFAKIDAEIKVFEASNDMIQADLFRRQAMTMRYEYRATRMAFLKWSEEQRSGGEKPDSSKAGG